MMICRRESVLTEFPFYLWANSKVFRYEMHEERSSLYCWVMGAVKNLRGISMLNGANIL